MEGQNQLKTMSAADVYVVERNAGAACPGDTKGKGSGMEPPAVERYAPLDGGWGWMCATGGMLTMMLTAGLIIRSAGIMFVSVSEFYGASATETIWINAVMMTLTFCLAPVSSILGRKIGARWTLFIAAGLSSVGFIASQFVTDISYLYGTISVLVGISNSLSIVPTISHVSLYFEKRRTLASGITMSGSGAGALISGPLTTALLEDYGLRGTFLILGGICLNYLVCGMLMRPLEFYEPRMKKYQQSCQTLPPGGVMSPTSEQLEVGQSNPVVVIVEDGHHDSANFKKEEGSAHALGSGVSLSNNLPRKFDRTDSDVIDANDHVAKKDAVCDLALLRKGAMWLIAVCFMFSHLGYFSINNFIPAHVDAVGLPEEDFALLVSLMGGVDVGGRIISGWLLDLHLLPVGMFFSLAIGLAGVLVVMMPVVGASLASLAVVCGLFALTISAMPPLQTAVLVTVVHPDRLHHAFGILQCFYGAPFIIAQPLAGYIFDTTGSWNIAFYYSGGILMLAAILMAGYTLQQRKRLSKVNSLITQ